MSNEMKFVPAEHFSQIKSKDGSLKDYLPVAWRLVWFREEHPDWTIKTEIIEHVYGEYAVFQAKIIDATVEPLVLSEGHGSESKSDFRDYLEKAETKAVGRALAMLGYGTQFAPDLDEGERVADTPVEKKKAEKKDGKSKEYKCSVCGSTLSKETGGTKLAGKFYCDKCLEKVKNADKY